MSNKLSLPFNLNCGYFDSHSFGLVKTSPKRVCTTFEVEYFLEDGNYTFCDGRKYQIRRDFVLICSPGEERYSELGFKTKYVKFAAEGKLAEMLNKASRYFHVSRSLEANNLLDEIIMVYTMDERDEILLQGKLLTYISLLLENSRRSVGVDLYKNEIIVTAQEFIKEHCGESIKLCDIAKAVNLSPNYFHTLFADVCKMTPRQYLEEYRLGVAKRLLITTMLTLGEIAEQSGFNNQQYLTKVFKSRVGCTPVQFKRQHQRAYFA